MINKVNLIPGIDIQHIGTGSTEANNAALPSLQPQANKAVVPEGGLMQTFFSNSSNQQRSLNIEKVEVNSNPSNTQDLLYELEMEAG